VQFGVRYKRLSQGRFAHWPGAGGAGEGARQLFAHELSVLLAGGNPDATEAAPQWRSITPSLAA
jgi:hypothetical protein